MAGDCLDRLVGLDFAAVYLHNGQWHQRRGIETLQKSARRENKRIKRGLAEMSLVRSSENNVFQLDLQWKN